ncbi:uncharacterized protein LOC142768995 isoform X2 [Rhipicephalus microplus]|uniref:uncharacterized protein LOC142768995 isoform X2 n=1 Tax=Rhipicephalus microplus TaxID=6941 RepID=UPI003F6C83A1
MTPKVTSAVFILWVVGISSATGPTQPNLPTAPGGHANSVGTIRSATPGSPDTVSSSAVSTVASVNQGGTGPSSSATSRTPVDRQPGLATHGGASSTGSTIISTVNPQASGSTSNTSAIGHGQPSGGLPSGPLATALPVSHSGPVSGKPATPKPLPINKNMKKTLPKTKKREPLNDHQLLRQLPKKRNERIFLVFQEQDIPFLVGPLNEPPLSVSVFRTQPGIPRKPPTLPRILRMRPL